MFNKNYWIPFTSNKEFSSNPRMVKNAKDCHYIDIDDRKIFDGISGLWCTGAGHNNEFVKERIRKQLDSLDYVCAFNWGHPEVFELSEKFCKLMPDSIDHVFYSNSGSEAVETALKIALRYHAIGGKNNKTLLVGREKGYHGVNFGGLSVGGISPNKIVIAGNSLPRVDFLPHTLVEDNRFVNGEGEHQGLELARSLLNIIQLHGAEQIAAVIIEPVAGSAGVIVPSKNYLKELARIAKENDILLIFDEVITAFGRLGKFSASEYFGVTPDIITTAKGMTNGAVPMGATFVSDEIYNTFINNSAGNAIEFVHGYTYSGHPLAVAAALGNLEAFEKQDLLNKSTALIEVFGSLLHSLKDVDIVKDIRNLGLMGAVELKSNEKIGSRAYEVFIKMYEAGFIVRHTGETLAFCPIFTSKKSDLEDLFESFRKILQTIK